MYITPQTNIRLLRGCPCDPEYINTLYFASATAQRDYFITLSKYNLNSYTYQRYGKGILRVQILADNLYDVNYMMFQNTAYGNKWFYAFVDNVEYINDNTTEIIYHIDEIQTWMFDWTFNQCFVERQHTATDVAGDNIITEPVEVGEYVYNDYASIKNFDFSISQCIIVAVTDVDTPTGGFIADGTLYDGIYGACQLYAFPATSTGATDVNALITAYGAKDPDAVVSIYMCPRDAVPEDYINTGGDLDPIPFAASGAVKPVTLGTAGTTIDGYTVRNKKLLTYPYNFENIVASDNSNLALRYEFFSNNEAKIRMYSTLSQPIQVTCTPVDYKGVEVDADNNIPVTMIDESITLANYPECSWNIDSWKVWWAQNAVPLAIKTVADVSTLALAAYKGYTPASVTQQATSMIGANGQPLMQEVKTPASFNPDKMLGAHVINQVANTLTNVYKASIRADQTKGNISSANALYSHGKYCFYHGRMSINRQQAEIIDSFFDKFGYAINKVTTPSIHTRTNWTYLKTIGCTINGNIPSDSEHIIEQIFNNGITFWTTPANVGNYSLSNAPLS